MSRRCPTATLRRIGRFPTSSRGQCLEPCSGPARHATSGSGRARWRRVAMATGQHGCDDDRPRAPTHAVATSSRPRPNGWSAAISSRSCSAWSPRVRHLTATSMSSVSRAAGHLPVVRSAVSPLEVPMGARDDAPEPSTPSPPLDWLRLVARWSDGLVLAGRRDPRDRAHRLSPAT
jgi:hypothetical protein